MIALLLLFVSSIFFGRLFNRLTLPKVVGEIFGGFLLGPTFLGHFYPGFYQDIFLSQGGFLTVVYWLGLVLLMFTSGLEMGTKFDQKDKTTIMALVIATTAIPLIFGWVSTEFFNLNELIGPANHLLSLKLIITVALAVTSIPVISKIFLDLGIIRTTFAKITLATATIHDIILWVFVSIAASLVSSRMPLSEHLSTYVVFGAFLAGILINIWMGSGPEETKRRIKTYSTTFFVPVYFAIVGIKLDLIHHFNVPFFVVFSVFAFIIQAISVLLASRWLGYNWLSSFNLAVALNNRGGPCIVLATLAFDLGIISENFFVTLVLLAIATSLTAGVWLRYVLKKGWSLLDK